MSRIERILAEDSDEDINSALLEAESWPDLVVWTDTPFRPSDDVVLLGFGFKFSSDLTAMFKVDEDGTTWFVKMDDAVPIWYKNGVRIGGRSYDDVVNQFSNVKKNGQTDIHS